MMLLGTATVVDPTATEVRTQRHNRSFQTFNRAAAEPAAHIVRSWRRRRLLQSQTGVRHRDRGVTE